MTNKTDRLARAATRASAYKAAQNAKGYVQCNLWVPAEKMAQFQIMAAALRDNVTLEVGPARDTVSGRLVRVE